VLTDKEIQNAKPRETLYRIADGDGLHLEVSPAGGKLWRLRYRFGGKEKDGRTTSWGASSGTRWDMDSAHVILRATSNYAMCSSDGTNVTTPARETPKR